MRDAVTRLDFESYKSLLDRFDENASIENYVALKRYSRGDTEISSLAEIDPLQALCFQQDLERAHLSVDLVRDSLSGDDRAIDELCVQIMERLINRRGLEREGKTHLQGRADAISDALVAHLIVAILEVFQEDGLSPNPSFVMLVREHLGCRNNEISKSHAKWQGKKLALFIGMQKLRHGEQPSIRQIAEEMNVQPSTISRWFPDSDFLHQCEKFLGMFVKVPSEVRLEP